MEGLAEFGNTTAPDSLLRLTELLAGDTDDAENLWKIRTQLKLVTNQDSTYQRKIAAVDKILSKMEDQILNTPIAPTVEGLVTSEDRQAEVILRQGELDTAREMYNDWQTRYTRADVAYKAHSNVDGTPKTEPGAAAREPPERPERRARSREKQKKGSEAKTLKPDLLTTQLSASAIKTWFKQFENYMRASDWADDEHEIKLAYTQEGLAGTDNTSLGGIFSKCENV